MIEREKRITSILCLGRLDKPAAAKDSAGCKWTCQSLVGTSTTQLEKGARIFRMQKITPFLWFDGQAEEAMHFYVSIFKNSKIGTVSRYGDGGPGASGAVMSATFQLDGQDFMALNGGPQFPFTEAISLYVSCETQAEVDELWDTLCA